jgi:hypothetical protein
VAVLVHVAHNLDRHIVLDLAVPALQHATKRAWCTAHTQPGNAHSDKPSATNTHSHEQGPALSPPQLLASRCCCRMCDCAVPPAAGLLLLPPSCPPSPNLLRILSAAGRTHARQRGQV